MIHFELKADVHIIVYMTQQTLGKLKQIKKYPKIKLKKR